MDKLTLAIMAGAYAIRNNSRLDGANYCTGFKTGHVEAISFYEAEKILTEYANRAEKKEHNDEQQQE